MGPESAYRSFAGLSRKSQTRKTRHKADKAPTSGVCLLLDLPFEIRQDILKFTLISNGPIQAQDNFVFRGSRQGRRGRNGRSCYDYDMWPDGKPDLAVLYTCRQLYHEGVDIFYNHNTFGITACNLSRDDPPLIDMLNMSPRAVFITHKRLNQCRNLKLSIFFRASGTSNEEGFLDWDHSVNALIYNISKKWQDGENLEIQVYNDAARAVTRILPYRLELLRCRKVKISGVPISMSRRLTKIIESGQPTIDLRRALGELREFLYTTYQAVGLPYRQDVDRIIWSAERSVELYSWNRFMLLRQQIIDTALQRMNLAVERVREKGFALQTRPAPYIGIWTSQGSP